MPKPTQFDEFDELDEHDESLPEACLVCEALCPDAVDGTLSEAERRAFDKHVAGCAHCAQELEDAQRGAAWLGLLKTKTPDPPASLLTRILAETIGNSPQAQTASPGASVDAPGRLPDDLSAEILSPPSPAPLVMRPKVESTVAARVITFPQNTDVEALAPHAVSSTSGVGSSSRAQAVANPNTRRSNVLSFRQVVQSFGSFSAGRGLHPRLAMTAAMAFFSIALTLNLTGVRLRDLRLSNLEPGALQRSAAEAEATAVRSFQNLKVVYQVESRVSELRQDPMWTESTKPSQQTPQEKQTGQENATGDRGQN